METKYHFPKTDLHLHIDGSFRPETIWELAAQRGVAMPADTLEGYKRYIEIGASGSVNQYLELFEYPTRVLQDKESLARVTRELIDDLAEQGVVYAELRFAPQIHTRGSLTQSDAVEAVLEGRRQGLEDHPEIKIGILCCMMSFGPETVNWDANAETVEVTKKYLGQGVVGIDLAGAEGFVPLRNFGPLFKRAAELGIPRTCHAGDSQGPDTVEDAIGFGAQRIGHGHHIYQDKDLCRVAAEKQVLLEICPTSNIQCCTEPSFAEHPAKALMDMGIPVSINTDNMTMARTTLEQEYDHCVNEMGFTVEDLIECNKTAIRCSFASEKEKAELLALFD